MVIRTTFIAQGREYVVEAGSFESHAERMGTLERTIAALEKKELEAEYWEEQSIKRDDEYNTHVNLMSQYEN